MKQRKESKTYEKKVEGKYKKQNFQRSKSNNKIEQTKSQSNTVL